MALFLQIGQPHGGGLDSLGCHHNRKLGGYHCHRGELAGMSFASKSAAQQELAKRQAKKQNQGTESKKETAPAEENEEHIVYVTASGKKYHGPNCSYLSKSRTAISLKDAKKKGYTACSKCNGR